MFRRRRQATRLGTRVARAALRTAKSVVRQARGAFVAGAVGTAAYKAGRKTTKTVKKTVGIPQAAPGNDWSISKRSIGKYKKPTISRLNKMLEVGMTKTIYRFQGLTNFDTNTGYFPIPNWSYSPGGQVNIPVHVYDLTCVNNVSAADPAARFTWVSTAANSDLGRAALTGQDPTGALSTTWHSENSNRAVASFPNSRIMRYDWTDVRINFYGPRKRTTRYDVFFVRIKDEFANPMIASLSNAALKDLMAYLERPCIFSNLQTYQTNVGKKMQIVKKYSYFVNAGQTTDVDITVGKIKEARIFMRHDKVYKLDWRHEGQGTDTLPHNQTDGSDYVQDLTHHNNPWHGSRLLMIIRAFAPERRVGITDYAVGGGGSDANIDPSYDILIRNAVSFPS